MRNSSIVLSIVALAVLVFSFIASYYTKNTQVITIGSLVCVGLIAVSTLLCCLSTPSEAKKRDEAYSFNEEMRSVWERFRSIEDQMNDLNADSNRFYDQQIQEVHNRIDNLDSKRK
jgi:hypothetical protein